MDARVASRRALSSLAAAAVVLSMSPAPSAEAAVARCFGARATIVGTAGDDVLRGTPGADVIVGLGGADNITGLGGNDRLCGGGGDDNLSGSGGRDRLSGEPGNDLLLGGAGDDTAYGGTGDDGWGGAQNRRGDTDRFYGGPGADTAFGGDRGRQRAYGGAGADTLNGGNGNDRLVGGPGNDTLQGFRGNDRLRGGPGRDTISFLSRFSEVQGTFAGNLRKMRVDLRSGRARGLGHDRLRGVEAVIPGGNSDVLLGSRRNETFYLSAESLGHDVINGRGGRDTIAPEPNLTYCCPVLRVDLARGTAWYGYTGDPVDAASTNRVTAVENIVGTELDDVLLGDRHNNRIYGWGGDDVLDGRAGRNWNDGGPGTDRCRKPAQGPLAVSCEAPFTG